MSTINPHTTRAAGTILTAAVYNADHINHVSNAQALNADKLEGATPPVVDGQAVLWEGTTGAALKTAGFFPANAAILMSAGAGILGGGDLSTNRSFATDVTTQVEAEAAVNNVKSMTALRVRQLLDHANAKASQAEAEAASDSTKWVSSLRVRQLLDHANAKASQAEAEAGVDDTKWTSPLRVKQAVLSFAPPPEVKAVAGGTGGTTNFARGCSVSGAGQTKTVTFTAAAANTNYTVAGWTTFGTVLIPIVPASKSVNGFDFSIDTGVNWEFAAIL